jgi:hypothetical protein
VLEKKGLDNDKLTIGGLIREELDNYIVVAYNTWSAKHH